MKDNTLAPYLVESMLATCWALNSKQTESTESRGTREGGQILPDVTEKPPFPRCRKSFLEHVSHSHPLYECGEGP